LEFQSANPTVVKSIRQRDMLNTWLRLYAREQTMPRIAEYQPCRLADERPDMMEFDVTGEADNARFLIIQEGARLTATYGNEHVDPDKRTRRYLDDAIGPERYARVVAPYRACVMRKRPTYSVSMVQDPDGKDVSYERLLLPFGTADAVERIVGSYKSISIEGGFKIDNLMGITPRTTPVCVVHAVIDLDFVRGAGGRHTSDDVIELS
jgi:hypothetical protein